MCWTLSDQGSFFMARTHRPNRCASDHVGRKGGRQHIMLGSGCFAKGIGTVLHELLHALGLDHEHQRPDRDAFIDVHHQNILPSKRESVALDKFEEVHHFNTCVFYSQHSSSSSIRSARTVGQRMGQLHLRLQLSHALFVGLVYAPARSPAVVLAQNESRQYRRGRPAAQAQRGRRATPQSTLSVCNGVV